LGFFLYHAQHLLNKGIKS